MTCHVTRVRRINYADRRRRRRRCRNNISIGHREGGVRPFIANAIVIILKHLLPRTRRVRVSRGESTTKSDKT